MHSGIHISIEYGFSVLLFLLILIPVWIFTVRFYSRTTPSVSRTIRIVCILSRGLALSLILWLLFRPLMHIRISRSEKPGLNILLDNSASMTLDDAVQSRGRQLVEIINSPVFQKLRNRYDVSFYRFSDRLYPYIPGEPLLFDGRETNLTESVEAGFTGKDGRAPMAVLLISDGAHNSGPQPENRSLSWTVPVYSIGLGESSEKQDIVLTQVTGNEIAFVNQPVPIQIEFSGSGFDGQPIDIVLSADGIELSRIRSQIAVSGLESQVEFSWIPEKAGDRKLTVSIDSIPGELTRKNNRRDLFIHVRESKKKLMLFCGNPGPDAAALYRQLNRENDIDIRMMTQRREGGFYEGTLHLPDIAAADILLFYDFPSRSTSASDWNPVAAALQKNPKPVFIFSGEKADPSGLTEFPLDIPCRTLGPEHTMTVFPELTPAGLKHAIPDIYENTKNRIVWSLLPPITTTWPQALLTPDTEILVAGRSESSPERQVPLLAARSLNGQKSLLFLGSRFYRWHMLMWHPDDPKDFFRIFFMNCLQWLSVDESIRPVRIHLENRHFPAGTLLPVDVEVYNESLLPEDKAVVQLRMTGPDSLQTEMKSKGNGHYTAGLKPVLPGEYHLIAEARLNDRFLGRDTTRFIMTDFQPEFFQTRARPGLLSLISEHSRGSFLAPDSLGRLLEILPYSDESVEIKKNINPLHHPLPLMIAGVLLTLEWWIRRRKGML